MKTIYCKVLLKPQDSLLQTIEHELRSTRPKLVPLLATSWLSWGACGDGVDLTKQQPDPQPDDMWYWPRVVPLLTTRSLYWGGGIWADRGYRWCQGGLGVTYEKWRQCIADNRTWVQVNQTSVSTTLGHQIPLPGGIKEHVGVMGEGYIWQNISLTHRLMTGWASGGLTEVVGVSGGIGVTYEIWRWSIAK